MKIEIPDSIVSIAMRMDALQANRNWVTTLEELGSGFERSRMLSQFIWDEIASIILRNVRREQGLPMFVPRESLR